MALSDACWEFCAKAAEAAEELSQAVENYADPESGFDYDPLVISRLRSLCRKAVTEDGFSIEDRINGNPGYDERALARLIRFAEATRILLDGPQSAPKRKAA